MRRKTDNESLLDDVFAETASADFREAMLGESLRVVRRRHQIQKIRRVSGALLVLVIAVTMMWRNPLKHLDDLSKTTREPVKKSYNLVLNQSFPGTAIVTTHPVSGLQFVTTKPLVGIVQTKPAEFRSINDDQLLSLLSPRPCALVQIGPDTKELVFINFEDEKDFPNF